MKFAQDSLRKSPKKDKTNVKKMQGEKGPDFLLLSKWELETKLLKGLFLT